MHCFVPPSPVYVNDTVVISSVGNTSETTAASLRAGIARPEQLDGFAEETEDGEENIVGYPIRLLTHGFEGAGRYIQLMRSGFEQVAQKISADEQNSHKDEYREIYLLMAVPDVSRYLQTLEVEEQLDENPFQFYNKGWDETVKVALDQSGLGELLSGYTVISAAPSSISELIQQSAALLTQKPNALVIAGFVDSLTDFAGLTWLNNMARLKSASNPVGLIPGEAVSYLFLTSLAKPGSVEVISVNTTEEEHPLHSDIHPEGKALNQLLVEYSKQNPVPVEGEFWSINNLTGEEILAMEWGRALNFYQKDTKTNPEPDVWLPNVSLGEVGICFVSIAIAWAQQAFRRNYAPTPTCAVAVFCYSNVRTLLTIKGVIDGTRTY
ncbi:MAG: hypothetical protein ABJK37_12235 [Paraglaciecola sp.]|uniref:hypothetical protein n=1 Tax=Paraglaciecola sp. TaxID=1920173 RepID=UPI003297B4BD